MSRPLNPTNLNSVAIVANVFIHYASLQMRTSGGLSCYFPYVSEQ